MAFSASAQASSQFLTGTRPVRTGRGAEVLAERFTITLATGDLANSTVGAVGILPAGHLPVGIEIDSAQLDSNGTPTLAYSVGLLNAAGTAISIAAADGGAAWATSQTTGRTAAHSGPIASRPMKTVTASAADRKIGIALTGGAATAVSGVFAVTLFYQAA